MSVRYTGRHCSFAQRWNRGTGDVPHFTKWDCSSVTNSPNYQREMDREKERERERKREMDWRRGCEVDSEPCVSMSVFMRVSVIRRQRCVCVCVSVCVSVTGPSALKRRPWGAADWLSGVPACRLPRKQLRQKGSCSVTTFTALVSVSLFLCLCVCVCVCVVAAK